MAYDPGLAAALRKALSGVRGVTERNMFGGICFLVNGNMLAGVETERYMFRVGKERHAEALARPGARSMAFTGRPLAGFVWVDAARLSTKSLASWVRYALHYVGTLPRKGAKGPARAARRRARPG
jgi:TfoX/Sxy family transcriptional regulator of competence genes